MIALHEHMNHKEPMISAIVGVAVLDLELADMIRARLRHKDDTTWGLLVSDTGPLQAFSQKVDMAFALGLIDEQTRKNLHILRRIRNLFAHPKRPISFEDSYILSQFHSVEVKSGRNKSHYISMTKLRPGRGAHEFYITLCYLVLIEFTKKRAAAAKAKARRLSKRQQHRFAILASLMAKQTPQRGQASIGLLSGLSALLPADYPNIPESTKALGGLLGLGAQLLKQDDKK